MIEISKVNKYFNRHKKNQIHVINNISLKMEDTGLVALLGPSGSGKTGGTLRRGWTAGKGQGAASYAQSLQVHHYGGYYVIEITNPVEYASYVEFGHRTANHSGWVEGKFMLTISEQEVQAAAPGILERRLQQKLGELFT